MKVRLQIIKNGSPIYSGTYDITGADSFGEAFAHVWSQVRQEQFNEESSIGALMDNLDNDVLDRIDGAYLRLGRL